MHVTLSPVFSLVVSFLVGNPCWKVFQHLSQSVSWFQGSLTLLLPHVCKVSVCLLVGQSRPGVSYQVLWYHPGKPVERHKAPPWCNCERNGDKGYIPSYSLSSATSIFQNSDFRTASANSITSMWLTKLDSLPIIHLGLGEDDLFHLGKVKLATCFTSPTFKALHPFNFCT